MKDNQITIKELLARQALRDHFAGLAMNACMLNSSLPYCKENAEIHAKRAYQQADAMLEERAK